MAIDMKLSSLLCTFSLLLASCTHAKEKIEPHPYQYELSQIKDLVQIHDQFYRNKYGYLYQKTTSLKNINGKLQEVEYFNGVLPQDIDPMTFEQIDNTFYAKDKRQIYVSHPTAGGMQIYALKQADLNSFKPLDYNLAVDKNHYYQAGNIIQNFNPSDTTLIKNLQGKIIALQSKKKIYRLDNN